MNRESDRLSARPPPDAQLSLKGREVLGIIEPLRDRALAAAAGEAKSMKQYPAFLLRLVEETLALSVAGRLTQRTYL
jgi:hypothetical protein